MHHERGDLQYRPATYFRPEALETHLLSSVKSAVLRRQLNGLFEAGHHGLAVALAHDLVVDPADSSVLESIHPMYMGGNYLPEREAGEIEIVRVCMQSTTGDVVCVYARREGARVRYRVVDEYDGEFLLSPTTAETVLPVTLEEIASFLTGAWPLFDVLESNFDHDVAAALDFFTVESTFYPQLDALCREMVREHFPQPDPEDDE